MARQADLLPVEEARARILERFNLLEAEQVPLEEARGRFLSESLAAPRDVPPFANSSMDGFAVVSASTDNTSEDGRVTLPVVMHIAAGSVGERRLEPDEAARIMTGAPLPEGADCVVPFEEVDDRGSAIVLSKPVTSGACVRLAGQDLRAGQPVLAAGTKLEAPQIALIAAMGLGTVNVVRRPRVGVLSTGDELVQPGNELKPGQIYESNTPMLLAAIAEAGGEGIRIEPARDDPQAIREALLSMEKPDLLLTSGGASVGDYDHMTDIVAGAGSLAFWRVRIRPGKPLLFGTFEGASLIGLPGNPTSAMVTFEEFVRPAIRKMLGAQLMRPEIEVIVDDPIDNRGGRRTYFRVRLEWREGTWHAHLAGAQDSAMLKPLAEADGLLEVSEEKSEVQPGEWGKVQVWRLDGRR